MIRRTFDRLAAVWRRVRGSMQRTLRRSRTKKRQEEKENAADVLVFLDWKTNR